MAQQPIESDAAAATLEVVSPGALAALQDLGRSGWRRIGVPRAGALDAQGLRIANRLVGQAEAAAAIEFFAAGPTLKALDQPVQLGLAGDFPVTLTRANGERFRKMILSKGHTEDYGAMFKAFRGKDPDITPLLQARGMAPR